MEAPERIWMDGTDPYTGTVIWTSDEPLMAEHGYSVPDLSQLVEYVRADISQEFYAPQISALEQCIAEQDQHIESLQNRFAEATRQVAELETEVEKRNHRLPPELVERIEVAIPKWQSELEIAEACSWGDMADEIQEIVDLLRKILEEVTYTGE